MAKAADKGEAAELLATVATCGGGSGWWLKQKTRARQRNCLQRWPLAAGAGAGAKATAKGKAAELLATVAMAGCNGGRGNGYWQKTRARQRNCLRRWPLAAVAVAGVTASLAGGRVAGGSENWAGGFAFWAECYNFAL